MNSLHRPVSVLLVIEAVVVAAGAAVIVRFGTSMADFDGEPLRIQPIGWILLVALLVTMGDSRQHCGVAPPDLRSGWRSPYNLDLPLPSWRSDAR